jgi:flagellar FliL protein
MSDKKPEAKPEGDGAKPAAREEAAPSGGFKAWLPLLLSVLLMPALAVGTTKFLIIPKVVHAREANHADADQDNAPAEAKTDGKEAAKARESKEGKDSAKPKETKEAKDSGKGHAGKRKQTVPITKVIVNVAGSAGSRYLMTSFTLVGTQNEFKNLIEENKDQLLDLANTAMASKTISDLEKPGARNQIRAELISIFNNALGGNAVQEIYFTEFAIQ